jgi:putative FmdB family regulatory protein
MPLYEYMCHRCGKTIESLQRFSDEPLTVHEGCGGELEKLISRSAFQLKGSGWYATDYAHGSTKTGTEASSNGSSDSKSENKTEGKSESKTESKSETKSESKPTESKSESKSESKPAPASSDKSS